MQDLCPSCSVASELCVRLVLRIPVLVTHGGRRKRCGQVESSPANTVEPLRTGSGKTYSLLHQGGVLSLQANPTDSLPC